MEMKCDLCNGTGRLLKPWFDATGAMTRFPGEKCFMCDGKGKVDEPQTKKPNTNFEDITSSLERLADFLETVKNACFDCASRGPYKSPDCPFADAIDDPYKCHILEWLKQEAKGK